LRIENNDKVTKAIKGHKGFVSSVTLGVLCAAAVILSGCRQDMHDPPKYVPLRESTFFNDARSARPLVEGTVARGQLHDDELMYTGKVKGEDATVFPMRVDAAVMARGQQRFNIYCSPCHGRTGMGDGMIVRRGYKHPPAFGEDRLRAALAESRNAEDALRRLADGLADFETGEQSDDTAALAIMRSEPASRAVSDDQLGSAA
jgi:hypothetical protein